MGTKAWTIRALLNVTTEYLQEKAIESPRLTAEALLAHQLGVGRLSLYLDLDKPLKESEVSGYRSLIRRRVRREPLQYITGLQEFWSLDFQVDNRVLIPRPETELLVEQALWLTQAGAPADEILDLGTGCGLLAVCLAREIQNARIWATDVSSAALEVAVSNAERHGVIDRIEFLEGDLLGPVKEKGAFFDMILSNPPYVAVEEYDTLDPEIRLYEPRLALEGREGGIYYVKRIIQEAPDLLTPGGWLMLEMAPCQTQRALTMAEETGRYDDIDRIEDYSHRFRMIKARKRR